MHHILSVYGFNVACSCLTGLFDETMITTTTTITITKLLTIEGTHHLKADINKLNIK